MNEINCPHCHKAFKIDGAGYANILQQVRDSAFEQQLHERLELAEKDKQNAVALAVIQAQNSAEKERDALAHQLAQTRRDNQAAAALAQEQREADLQRAAAASAAQIQDLNAKLQVAAKDQQLAVAQALSAVEKQRDELKSRVEQTQLEKSLAEQALKENTKPKSKTATMRLSV